MWRISQQGEPGLRMEAWSTRFGKDGITGGLTGAGAALHPQGCVHVLKLGILPLLSMCFPTVNNATSNSLGLCYSGV